MSLRLCSCILFWTITVSAVEPSSTDWPQWRGPKRDNKSTQTGLLKSWEGQTPKLEWKVAGVGGGYASVSVVGDRLYTTGSLENGQHVIAIDLKNHAIVWKQQLIETSPKPGGYDGAHCTPTVDGDKLYATASDGQIACLNAADGKIVWSKRFDKEWGGRMMSGWGFSESPLVDGDRVLCTPGGEEAMVVALDKKTGDELWRTKMTDQGRAGAGYSSLVISEGAGVKQYVTTVGRGAIGVRASDGKHLWTYGKIANGTANIPTPIVTGDNVFASTGYGAGAALLKLSKEGDGVKADEVWFKPGNELQNHHGGMVLDGDFLYFGHGHNNGFPVCVELATGKTFWGGEQQRGPGSGSAAVTYADGNMIFRYQSGEVALIEATPSEYRLKGVFKPEVVEREGWAHPVVAQGKLFLREQNTLMCYDLAAAK